MSEKVTIPVKITMSETMYRNFLRNLEETGFVFMKYHDGIVKIVKVEE